MHTAQSICDCGDLRVWLRGPSLKNDFLLKTVLFRWNFQGKVILKRYVSGKNFNPIDRTIPDLRLDKRPLRRTGITPWNLFVLSSGWCQMEAHMSTQLLYGQNFYTRCLWFFTAHYSEGICNNNDQMTVNPTFLDLSTDRKKFLRKKVYSD